MFLVVNNDTVYYTTHPYSPNSGLNSTATVLLEG